jgi:hypothetical protein
MNDSNKTSVELNELDLELVAAGKDNDNFIARGPRGGGAFRGDNFSGFRGPRGNGAIWRN